MNRGEAVLAGLLTGFVSVIFYYGILYFLVFDNFLVVFKQAGTDLYPVEVELWWMIIGFGFILGLRSVTKTYRWMRRDFCKHCGKGLN